MKVVQGPGQDSTTQAQELLGLALQGAKVNCRPDLIRRLTRARRTLGAATSAAERGDAAGLAAGEALRVLDSLEFDLRARRAMLSDPARAARLGAELDSVQSRSDRFNAGAREWRHVMGESFAALTSELEFHLRTSARAVVAVVEDDINTGDPGEDRDRFDAGVRARLVIEADLTYQRLHSGAREVAGRLAALLELPAPHPVPVLPVTAPGRLVADLPPPRAPRTGAPVAARLLKVFMPGYAGVMITLVASRFLGAQLPGWLVAVLAVVGALALGGAAACGERKHRLDRRRGDAALMLRGTVEEFQLAMVKQVRDAIRVLHQNLRRATADTVGRLGPAVAEELTAIRAAAETARRAPAGLSDIADDLVSVAELRERALVLRRATSSESAPRPRPPRTLHPVA